jgi:hypothetical protein
VVACICVKGAEMLDCEEGLYWRTKLSDCVKIFLSESIIDVNAGSVSILLHRNAWCFMKQFCLFICCTRITQT